MLKSAILSKLSLSIATSLLASQAMAAYFQADLPSARAQSSVGTHLLIVGKGLEVGDQWLRAAHTQALLFKDKTKHGPIRIIGAIENSRTLQMMRDLGYQNIQTFNQTFTGPRLNAALQNTARIASMDFIGHNGAVLGFVLEDYSNRFFLNDARAMSSLRSKMTADSYVRLMGCNTGWNLAPEMAKALQVPVAGTFTFADIQKLFETNEWFYHDIGRFPSGGKFLSRNDVSYTTTVKCDYHGGCLRLKPVHIAYQGKHGSYGGTVPFLKYFCAGVATADCQRRMALSMTQFASVTASAGKPTAAQYQDILADFFCPAVKDNAKREACKQAVKNHASGTVPLRRTYTNSSGPTVICNLQKCETQQVCSDGSCAMVGKGDMKNSTTFVDELDAYIKGYKLLN